MQTIDSRRRSIWPNRAYPSAARALPLLAVAPICAALDSGIVFETSADAVSTIIAPDRLAHHLARGDQIRIFERSGSELELIIVELGVGPATGLSGVYQATITGNTHSLNLREKDVLVSLEQNGDRLGGTFDRGRGKLWGEVDGDRIRFDWVAISGNSGRGEWRVAADGRTLQGRWYSNWLGEGGWSMRRAGNDERDPAAAAVIIGERPTDRARIEVSLDAIERIRLVASAGDSRGFERAAGNDPGGVQPGASRQSRGGSDESSRDAANETPYDLRSSFDPGETGLEIGALAFFGVDFGFFHRPAGSSWLIGFRHVETEGDFVSIDFDDTDREKITITGPFARYLLSPDASRSFYLSGAFYRMSQEVDCRLGSDEDSATGLFVGGGFMGRWHETIGYNVGIMVAPGLSLETDTGDCSSETSGGFDASANIVIAIR